MRPEHHDVTAAHLRDSGVVNCFDLIWHIPFREDRVVLVSDDRSAVGRHHSCLPLPQHAGVQAQVLIDHALA